MQNKINLVTDQSPNWFIVDFTSIGFIGKTFKLSDLHEFINFDLTRYSIVPVDWALDDLVQQKYCAGKKYTYKECFRLIHKSYWKYKKPPLFHHIGKTSSLKGKIQKVKEIGFRRTTYDLSVDHQPSVESFGFIDGDAWINSFQPADSRFTINNYTVENVNVNDIIVVNFGNETELKSK